MKISIAMATYNGGAHLAEQLASFVAQTRRPDELVVCDDGSTDATPQIIRAFAGTAPFPVRLEINPRNLGFAQNFGRALSLTTGDLVFMSDQDDVWLETKIARMVALAEAAPAKACFLNDALLADGALTPTGGTRRGQIRAAGRPETAFVMGCCTAVRRALLDIALPIPAASPSHDNWLVELADLLGQTVRIDEALQYYRRHGGNVSSFLAASPERAGPAERLRQRAERLWKQARSSANLERERTFLRAQAARLAERQDACAQLVGPKALRRIAATLDRRLEVLDGRMAARRMPATARPAAILTLWRRGAYRVSGGIAGLLKDTLGGSA